MTELIMVLKIYHTRAKCKRVFRTFLLMVSIHNTGTRNARFVR
jgi:hypothetical protein